MKNKWILDEAKKIDEEKDYVILENPDNKSYLDNILIKKYWPVIKKNLKNTLYNYSPNRSPEIDFKLSYELTRNITFMLIDGQRAIFRGGLSCSLSGWMLHSELFLGLSHKTDPSVIFKILGDSKFRGSPPTLGIYEEMPSDYFHIVFQCGNGASWAYYSDDYIYGKIAETIDINARLYDLTIDGNLFKEDLDEFLSLAYKVYAE